MGTLEKMSFACCDALTTHLQMPEAIHLHASQAFSDGHCPVSRYKEHAQHNLNPKKMALIKSNQIHISTMAKIRKYWNMAFQNIFF